ncbi:MAG: nicotinamide-nucleotide amidohydrolase family protein [Anaerolineae bacterium]|nr:nicotinamide-nucleotide amidohydrolase family protein [Anaerolineae bacterium]
MNLGLVEQTGKALHARGWTVCSAESCTGGLVAAWLTEIAGSSDYVLGGVVAYANAIKQALLGVQEATLRLHGAVSPETAAEMALGAQGRFGADLAVSVTGIAGPGGGTPDKPVGLTYIGLAGRGGIIAVERHVWPGDRHAVREASATRALELILQATHEAHS